MTSTATTPGFMSEAILAAFPGLLCPEDVVQYIDEGNIKRGILYRSWVDEQDPEYSERMIQAGLTPLLRDQLQVIMPTGHAPYIFSTQVQSVLDRPFFIGDQVRSLGGQGQAGIVISRTTHVQLHRALDEDDVLEGWYDVDDLALANAMMRGDHVFHRDWVGTIEQVLDYAVVETKHGVIRRVCDVCSTLSVGTTHMDVLHERIPGAQNILEQSESKRVCDVKQIVIAVNWLCTNQRNPPTNQEAFIRPQRYWHGQDMQQLTFVRNENSQTISIGNKVVFKDQSRFPPKAEADPPISKEGERVFAVNNTRSTVTVLWQDGTQKQGYACEFEPVFSIDDELDTFPGDVGLYNGANPPRVAVVQSMNSQKRTIKLKFFDADGTISDTEEIVSGLEFDQHGPPPHFGVKRNDLVLVLAEDHNNGSELPTVPSMGESEITSGLFPTQVELKAEISSIGMELANAHKDDEAALMPKSAPEDLAEIDWYGVVVDLRLDGTILVEFPSKKREVLPLHRVYRLDDGFGPDDETDSLSGYEDMMDHDDGGTDQSWHSWGASGGVVRLNTAEIFKHLVDREADDEEMDARSIRSKNGHLGTIVLSDSDTGDDDIEVTNDDTHLNNVLMPAEIEDDKRWARFLVLDEAPSDHHYFDEKITTPSKQYMARVQKEQRILSSSLPPNILVRAYEDRTDLLRCLIIGPLGTPFQNAPFLFDVYLSPTGFPQEPPLVYFHAWVAGTRVSPNLYSEGKVCLSLLNTWTGTASESWSSSNSSILQIFISIQALIMVEKPYYTEPGFEKQIGTSEGEAASDLYNERTFVLTRAFVKRAVEYPPANFADEIEAYYHQGLSSDIPGALPPIIEQASSLLKESEKYESEQGKRESDVVNGLKVLTEGAGLSLKRSLSGLEKLVKKT